MRAPLYSFGTRNICSQTSSFYRGYNVPTFFLTYYDWCCTQAKQFFKECFIVSRIQLFKCMRCMLDKFRSSSIKERRGLGYLSHNIQNYYLCVLCIMWWSKNVTKTTLHEYLLTIFTTFYINIRSHRLQTEVGFNSWI